MSEFVINGDMFGMYAKIPTGFSKEMHIYKIVSVFESNTYCDVPLLTIDTKETTHDKLVIVLNVIHCGIDESEVIRVALKDCEVFKKEPHECNSDLISRKKLIRDLFYSADGNRYPTRDCDNFPITISFEDLRKAINNQQQVQPIVRSAEEVVEMLNKISCSECEKNSSHCHFSEKDCKNYWFEWLTKKEV